MYGRIMARDEILQKISSLVKSRNFANSKALSLAKEAEYYYNKVLDLNEEISKLADKASKHM